MSLFTPFLECFYPPSVLTLLAQFLGDFDFLQFFVVFCHVPGQDRFLLKAL
jgi:hypothetical protein